MYKLRIDICKSLTYPFFFSIIRLCFANTRPHNRYYVVLDVFVIQILHRGDFLIRKHIFRLTLLFVILAFSCTTLLPVSAAPTTTNSQFADVQKADWFCDDVTYVVQKGLMNGTSADMFSPNETTKRGMIVTILWRLEGKPIESASNFSDVHNDAYYFDAVNWAYANKIVSGYDNTTFGPEDNVTREQLASIIYNYAKQNGYDLSNKASLSVFEDINLINDYAVSALEWATANKIVTGTTESTVEPQGLALRCQTAAILHRFCSLIPSENPDSSDTEATDDKDVIVKNMFNPDEVEHGSYSNGVWVENPEKSMSGFIPAKAKDKFRYKYTNKDGKFVESSYKVTIYNFDKDKNFLTSNYRSDASYFEVANDSRIAYIRFGFSNGTADIVFYDAAAGDIPLPVKYGEPKTLSALKAEAEANIFHYEDYGLPVLKFTGDISKMTKENAVTLSYEYGDRSGECTLKWQGSSSVIYPKKNYTVKFDEKFEAAEGWGEEKKYCLKANYIDFSHSRNIVSAKLWGQVVKTRAEGNEKLNSLVNGGGIDGFPVCVVINDEYVGLYTFNIPKDGWMFGMGDGTQEGIICADGDSSATGFYGDAIIKIEDTPVGQFSFEYATNDEEDIDAWMTSSLNTLINACRKSDGTDLDTTVAQYLDWESAIDYYIFTTLIHGHDMIGKNYILATYDGTKWFFSAYDMDSTYGLNWNGTVYKEVESGPTLTSFAGRHKVMSLIKNYKKDELKARYTELRSGVLSEDNVIATFENFINSIPKELRDEECKLWPDIPNTDTNNLSQIADHYRKRCAIIDAEMESL